MEVGCIADVSEKCISSIFGPEDGGSVFLRIDGI
jgi:hypothetical protein